MISLVVVGVAAAAFFVVIGIAVMGGVAWLMAKALLHFRPQWNHSTVINLTAAIVPLVLTVNLAVGLTSAWIEEPNMSGPDVQGNAFAIVVIVLFVGGGWLTGRWAASKAVSQPS